MSQTAGDADPTTRRWPLGGGTPARFAAEQSTPTSGLRSFFARLLDQRRASRDGYGGAAATRKRARDLASLCRDLISGRGEASGTALAREVLLGIAALDAPERSAFFDVLSSDFSPDPDRLDRAWAAYAASRSPETMLELSRAVEPPRQELLRRLNQAPGGTQTIVGLREKLLEEADGQYLLLDEDLVHLLTSWFNRGFLMLERISWSSPADLLERIIRYEAVHMIQGWDDLRRRLQPPDRRCYAFFHPSLVDEPLIFVEVALTRDTPASIQDILSDDRVAIAADEATTAVFYSISNCQEGLRGISFGNLLIKQVVEELKRELPRLKTFVTLSPAPRFAMWLEELRADPASSELDDAARAALDWLNQPDWPSQPKATDALKPVLPRLAARYFLHAKGRGGLPFDPVARFHLGNGARLEHVRWLGDTSPKGIAESAGIMVNYLYDPKFIEKNHEAYSNHAVVAAASAIERLAG